MTGRERFNAIAQGKLKGELYLPLDLNLAWFMDETLERWHGEGLPVDANLAEYFNLDRVHFTGGAPYSPIPYFEHKIISEDAETQIVQDALGATLRIFKQDSASKMPQWLEYPIRTRQDWLAFRERLNPDSPERYPANWQGFKEQWEVCEWPLGIAPGSFFGHTLQRWIGTENLCIMFYEEPALVHEMLEYLEEFFLTLITPFLENMKFDFASFGEDIAFKGRSFISPKLFREFILPHYVSICTALQKNGIQTIFVDSDGFIDELIPLWMEVGINAFSPLEVAAGEDALALKQKYGDDIVLAGGIDKRELTKDRAAIIAQADKAKHVMELGGYFPAVDHSVPPDVPLEAFEILLQELRK